MLSIESLSAYYGPVRALDKVSFEFEAAQISAIIGSNGAGKTTLLRVLSGLLTPREGKVILNGQNVTGWSPRLLVLAGLAHVPEGRHILPSLSVADNLLMGAYGRLSRRMTTKRGLKREFELVYDVFPVLATRRRQMGSTLSGGEQQMLAIGRALMARPRLLMIDEPSMGLAPMVVDHIFDVLRKLNREGLTVLLVEQDAEKALALADHGYVMETGEVVLGGPAMQLAQDERVRRIYLGGE